MDNESVTAVFAHAAHVDTEDGAHPAEKEKIGNTTDKIPRALRFATDFTHALARRNSH